MEYPSAVDAGAVIGGLVGLVLGYDQSTELATSAATYLNNTSHLLAPVTAFAQLGISVLGTAVATVCGAAVGAFAGFIAPLPYYVCISQDPEKVPTYSNLKQALERQIELTNTRLEPA